MLQLVLLYSLTFISGLFFGSFFNLVSDRIVNGKSIVKGRSECDHCKKTLQPKNLIPLFSFVVQKGKCSFCGKKLSFYYPFSELLTGLTFTMAAYYTNLFNLLTTESVLKFLFLLCVFSFYIILVLTDLKFRLIPNKIVYPAIFFVLAYILSTTAYFTIDWYFKLKSDSFGIYLLKSGYLNLQISYIAKDFLTLLISSFAIAFFFWFLVFITKGRGMGQGDIRLGFLIGLFNGFPFNIIAIFLAFVIGAVYSLVMIALKKHSLKDTIAFGPFLIVSSVVTLIWGQQFLSFYINLF